MSTPTSYGTKYELYNVDFQRGDVRHFFSESDRSAYFNGLGRVNSGTLTSYIRQNEDFTVNKTWADVREANYVRYDNNDGAGWRYAYVDKLEVVSTSATKLYITEDAWQNNMFNFSIQGTRLRGHVDRLKLASSGVYNRLWSVTPEQIDITLEVNSVGYNFSEIRYLWYVFSESPLYTKDKLEISPFIDGMYYIVVPFIGKPYDVTYKFASGSTTYQFDASVLEDLENSAYIVNKFYTAVPPTGTFFSYNQSTNTITFSAEGGKPFTFAFTRFAKDQEQWVATLMTSSGADWENPSTIPATMGLVNNTRVTASLSPKNIRNRRLESKMYIAPYNYSEVGFGNARLPVYNEWLTPGDDIDAQYFIAPSAAGMYCLLMYPKGYNNNLSRVKTISVPASQSATVRRDVENTYLAANGERLNNQLVSGIAKMVAGVSVALGSQGALTPVGRGVFASGLNDFRNYNKTKQDMANAPDTMTLNGNTADIMLSDSQLPYAINYIPANDDSDRLYSYFYTYGYTINEWQEKTHATLRSRYYFDYYLMADDVHVDIDDSNTARQQMQEDLQKGVTFWHWNPTNNDIQHRYENLEMSIYQSQQ